jgi:hypothetical protein
MLRPSLWCVFETRFKIMSQNENTGYEDDIMAIAGGDGLNHSLQSLIATVLADRGVPSSMEGSVLYAIYVYRRDVQKAMEILQSDPRLIKEKVIFYKRAVRVNCPRGTI